MIKIQNAYSAHKIKVGYTEVSRSITKAAFKLFNFGDLEGALELLKAQEMDEAEAMAVLTAMQDSANGTLRTYGVDDDAILS